MKYLLLVAKVTITMFREPHLHYAVRFADRDKGAVISEANRPIYLNLYSHVI